MQVDAQLAGALAAALLLPFDALFGGPISGASMNPARSLGPALAAQNLDSIWVYLLAPPLGAALGALTYSFLRRDDASEEVSRRRS